MVFILSWAWIVVEFVGPTPAYGVLRPHLVHGLRNPHLLSSLNHSLSFSQPLFFQHHQSVKAIYILSCATGKGPVLEEGEINNDHSLRQSATSPHQPHFRFDENPWIPKAPFTIHAHM